MKPHHEFNAPLYQPELDLLTLSSPLRAVSQSRVKKHPDVGTSAGVTCQSRDVVACEVYLWREKPPPSIGRWSKW